VIIFESVSFPPSFFPVFEIGLDSLSDFRSGGNMSLKPGYSGSRRPADAENIVRFKLKWGKKMKMPVGCPISQKIGEMGCKVAKNERNLDQGDDEDAALDYIQQHKNCIQKKRQK